MTHHSPKRLLAIFKRIAHIRSNAKRNLVGKIEDPEVKKQLAELQNQIAVEHYLNYSSFLEVNNQIDYEQVRPRDKHSIGCTVRGMFSLFKVGKAFQRIRFGSYIPSPEMDVDHKVDMVCVRDNPYSVIYVQVKSHNVTQIFTDKKAFAKDFHTASNLIRNYKKANPDATLDDLQLIQQKAESIAKPYTDFQKLESKSKADGAMPLYIEIQRKDPLTTIVQKLNHAIGNYEVKSLIEKA